MPSEDTKERIAKVVEVGRTVLHYGWIPFIIYVGFARSNPQPSLIKCTGQPRLASYNPTSLYDIYVVHIFYGTYRAYYQFAHNLQASQCQQMYEAQSWIFVSGAALVEIIFSLRTWAVWKQGTRSNILYLKETRREELALAKLLFAEVRL
ncbi:hypothetical protein D9756_000204 [Leucocoprinus leucothites]|uniref:Uncharacterized protein n=1 Tax=Leucocoprinus leucothites TaxID=201217 RepID=A0A8H5GEI1_9AGAR|nr:hypothetical protein D9756_000204 [Leucoagaricus leucothites]